jgi:squalene cyclase
MLSTIDLSQVIQLIGERLGGAPCADDALPPEISVAQSRPLSASRTHCRRSRQTLGAGKIAEALIEPLLSHQNRDGGWGNCFDSKGLRRASQVDSTACVLMALEHFNSSGARQAKDGGACYLRAAQQADGSWVDHGGTASLSATSSALCGLLATGISNQDEAIAAGINWLIIRQHESCGRSGCWDKGDARQAASAIASVLLALVAAGKANHAAARRAVELLLESQCDEGHWNESGFNRYDAASGRWLRNELQSAARPLLSLSRWIVAAATAQAHAGQEMSLRLVGAAAED